MTSSSKKKTSKKKDFQKPKLRVGKARPKPTNFTDTSFKAKAITLAHQSLTTSAPTATSQFSHHLSLLTSHSSSQKRDSLAHLTTHISTLPTASPLPQPTAILIPKLAPLILDPSNSVRAQLLKLFRALPARDIPDHVEQLLLYVRAGMTHLATDIHFSATEMMEWLLETAGDAVVSCAGGWLKMLKTFLAVLSWPLEPPPKQAKGGGWSHAPVAKTWSSDTKLLTRTLHVLAIFLHCGLDPPSPAPPQADLWPFPLHNTIAHMLPTRSNAFAHLNLFGAPRDVETQMYEDHEGRRGVFEREGYRDAVKRGFEGCRREGGEVGRAAKGVGRALQGGM